MMKVVKANQAGLKQAVKILKAGGVIVFPTDTAYGLGGIFNSRRVQARILKIKQREDPKFTLVASGLSQVEKFFKLNQTEKKLAKKYWPGPLSIAVSSRFAVRVSSNAVACRLCRLVGYPLIATSANIAGQPSAYDAKQVIRQFKDKKNQPELMIGMGRLKKKKTSMIIEVKKGQLLVLRKGPIKLQFKSYFNK